MTNVTFQFLGSGDAFGTGGRFNTCFHVRSVDKSFLIDCGATSLVAMRKFDVDPNDIDTIFLTHLHGDHFGGVVFMLMDARYVSARTKPLTIAGPKGVRDRVIAAMNVLYPGCWEKNCSFDVRFVELRHDETCTVDGINVTPFHARHLQDGNDFILRFDVADKVVTYSGDTGWTEELIKASADADLFVTEVYHFNTKSEFHLDYETLVEKADELSARRTVITHMGQEMLERSHESEYETAHDGLVLTL